MRILSAAVAVLVVTSGCAWVGRVGVSSTGAQPVSGTTFGNDVSPNGRYVVFTSDATNLVPNDTNNASDVFLRDNQTGTTERVSVGANAAQGNSGSNQGLVSSDGRYVAFESDSDNLVTGDTNTATDVFVRDRQLATTTRVSIRNGGGEADDASFLQSMTPDAGIIVFSSDATNLIGTTDQNFVTDVYIRDRVAAKTQRISVGTDGSEGDSDSTIASISDNGRYVAFLSAASNWDINDSGVFTDPYVRDRTLSTTTRLTGLPGGDEADGDSTNVAISGDGSTVAFETDATNLIGQTDNNGTTDVYAVTMATMGTGVFERISVAKDGGDPSDFSFLSGISDNGRFVLFQSGANNLIGLPTTALSNSFIRDRTTGSTSLGGITQNQSEPANADPAVAGSTPNAISGDGRYVLFTSTATDVIQSGDSNGIVDDLFMRSNPIPFFFVASPATLTRGTTVTVSLTGNNLHAGSVALFGDGITVNSVTAVGETKLDVNVTIAANAPLGARTPIVVDPGTGAGPLTGGLAFFPALLTVV
jgi:hypothetical protein